LVIFPGTRQAGRIQFLLEKDGAGGAIACAGEDGWSLGIAAIS